MGSRNLPWISWQTRSGSNVSRDTLFNTDSIHSSTPGGRERADSVLQGIARSRLALRLGIGIYALVILIYSTVHRTK